MFLGENKWSPRVSLGARNAIALLSNYPEKRGVVDPPSPTWLGRWADRETVRRSGLWNVNHVDEEYDPAFLAALERLVDKARRREQLRHL